MTLILPPESMTSNSAAGLVDNPCVIHPIHGSSFGFIDDNAGSGVYLGTNGFYAMEHSGGWQQVSLSISYSLSGWHHIVVNYIDKVPFLYIDGKLIKSGLRSPRDVFGSLGPDSFLAYVQSGLGAGYWPSGPTSTKQYYKGKLDDFRFYNRALTLDEITYLANN
jgi:hypothetical protein